MAGYVHGYSQRESARLCDQANTLAELLHHDNVYPPGSRILEAGCGVGAQTVHLAGNNPECAITSVDISPESLEKAKAAIELENLSNVEFRVADIFDPPFENGTFDHVFVCFVLEHLENPLAALAALKPLLKKGGGVTVVEGDHGSFYCHPESGEAKLAVNCLVEIQARLGGDSLIGRRLYPLLRNAGFEKPTVSPRMVYVDSSRPGLVEGFSKNTFIAMVEGVREQALSMKLIDKHTWEKGIADLYRATEENGTFCYTFFKAMA